MTTCRIRIQAWLLLVALASLAPQAQAGGVRIVQAPGLGSLPDVQAAVDAAFEGDTLLLGEGSYTGFVIDGKSLQVIGLPEKAVQVQGTVEVRNLGAGQSVVLAGLAVTGRVATALSEPGLRVVQCAGHVRLQSCSFTGGAGQPGPTAQPQGSGGGGVVLEHAAWIAFAGCTLRGGNGHGFHTNDPVGTGGRGGDGVHATGSAVALYDCTVAGGPGGPCGLFGGRGGDGYVAADFGVFASGCEIRGGHGGAGTSCCFCPEPIGGDGGAGLVVGAAQARLLDVALFGGPAGVALCGMDGNPGPAVSSSGIVQVLRGTRRALAARALAGDETLLRITLSGLPGDRLFLSGAAAPGFVYVSQAKGVWLLPPKVPSGVVPLGVVPASGALVVDLPLGDVGAVDQLSFLQGLVVDAQGASVLTGPLQLVVLDREAAPDCDGDLVSDLVAVLEGLVVDCGSNLVPDECDPDCNGNGRSDGCDIALGSSLDCNANQVPDECDLGTGTSADCNGNSVPDECDIASGHSLDLNLNGVPDECEGPVVRWVDASAPPGGNGSAAQPFAAIRPALLASLAGDTVVVRDGLYRGSENKNLGFGGRDLVLTSENGPAACIIDCEGAGRGFELASTQETPAARIAGFTIRNAVAPTGMGGGIRLRRSHATIAGCVIEDCFAPLGGGGIAIEDAQFGVRVTDTRVLRCRASEVSGSGGRGGGIRLRTQSVQQGEHVVLRCVVEECRAERGGGIGIDGWNSPLVSHTLVRACSASVAGGGLFADVRASATSVLGALVDDCVFRDNVAPDGGALSVADFLMAGPAPRLTLTGCSLSGNQAGARGGALFVSRQGVASVANSILWGNSAPSGAELHVTGAGSSLAVAWSDVQGDLAGVAVTPGSVLQWGAGNLAVDPLFAGPELRLGPGSPCTDAGDNAAIPPDRGDVDGDGDTLEPVPLDKDGLPRRRDDPAVPDTGSGRAPLVDLGALERQP